MSVVDGELGALVRCEAEHVDPPAGAKERGWARLVAAVHGGEGGPGDAGGQGNTSTSGLTTTRKRSAPVRRGSSPDWPA